MKQTLRLLCIQLAVAGVASAATVPVTQTGFTFVPDSVTVAVGDTVQWLYTSGDHTVTSGLSPFDPDMGFYFNSPLNVSNPIFLYVFDQPGAFPYFCLPHYFFGMTGVVVVEGATPVDSESWGSIKERFAP